MSADVELLREAAKEMRARADLATAWQWWSREPAAVALAVADWLDYAADMVEYLAQAAPSGSTIRALAVARIYLGRES